MTIDKKRLATDAAYWGECGAPEDATHYDVADGEPKAWMKKDGDYWYAWVSSGNWSQYAADIHEVQSDFIPRPQSEWVDGLPYNAEYKARLPDNTTVYYRKDDDGSWQIWGPHSKQWLYDGYANDAGEPPYDLEVIVIPTKAQRDREELIGLIANRSIMTRAGEIAEDIIAAGWRKDQ